MEDFGSFWAINMLAVERMHVLLKRMASGTRNKMQVFFFPLFVCSSDVSLIFRYTSELREPLRPVGCGPDDLAMGGRLDYESQEVDTGWIQASPRARACDGGQGS